jgi:hypothetical protein
MLNHAFYCPLNTEQYNHLMVMKLIGKLWSKKEGMTLTIHIETIFINILSIEYRVHGLLQCKRSKYESIIFLY